MWEGREVPSFGVRLVTNNEPSSLAEVCAGKTTVIHFYNGG